MSSTYYYSRFACRHAEYRWIYLPLWGVKAAKFASHDLEESVHAITPARCTLDERFNRNILLPFI